MSVVDEFSEVLERILPTYRANWGEREDFEARMGWQRLLANEGWAAPAWPEQYGGRGLNAYDRVACDRLLAEAGVPLMAGVLGLQNVGPALMMFGSEEQKLSLPRIVDGSELWVQGFSEPAAGSDLAGLRTQAKLEGDSYVVNGQKIWTTDGMEATHMMALVRTGAREEKHGSISVLLIDLSSEGVERRPIRQITGEEGFAEVFFQDVRVPRANLLGDEGAGWLVTTKTLGYERTGVINQAARLEREVGRVVANAAVTDPAHRDALTRCWMDARLVGLLGARALAVLGDGGTPGPEQSIIKFAWSQLTTQLADVVADVRADEALLGGTPTSHRYLRARSSTLAAGTTEVMRSLLAEKVLGLPREPKLP